MCLTADVIDFRDKLHSMKSFEPRLSDLWFHLSLAYRESLVHKNLEWMVIILYQRITCNNVLFCVTISLSPFITAHKRRLRRLCFHRCLSVHGRGEHCMLGYTPPKQTIPRQTPPWADTPLWADTPPGRHPTCPVHAGIHTLLSSPCWDTHSPVQCMLGYGQQAGGMHPTGMHSCLLTTSINLIRNAFQHCAMLQ